MTHRQPDLKTRSVRYHPDAGRLLDRLTRAGLIPTEGARPVDTVLLESVDIATRTSRTTILLLEASTRLTCRGDRVTVEALAQAPLDGASAVSLIREALAEQVSAHGEADGLPFVTVTMTGASDEEALEERERLRAPSTIEPLRILSRRTIDHPHLPLEAGVVAFDYLATFETLPDVAMGLNTCPDYVFYDARILLVIDHPTKSATLVGASLDEADLDERIGALAAFINRADDAARTEAPTPPEGAVATAAPTQSDSDFEAVVETMKESITTGDVYQVVPSRGFTMACPDALAAYHELREQNPSPYMFYVATSDFELFGASPESALLYSAATGRVAIRPIAGTRPRGLRLDGAVDPERDIRLELELRTDAKEVAEHVMLVDLARNDVARVSVPGTRTVDELLRVDRYSRVMHLVSEVSGRLAPDLDALDAFRASMTMGTLTGAPKLRAAELIRESEGVRRGSYGGSVGYIRGDGELDTCIVIRSAFVADEVALVQAGAGVVADSVPAAEARETVHKASAVLHAIAAAQSKRLVIDTGAAGGHTPAKEA